MEGKEIDEVANFTRKDKADRKSVGRERVCV